MVRRRERIDVAGRLRVGRFLANPGDAIRRVDRFSRRWPLSACFGAFAFVAARGVIDGQVLTAAIFALLSILFLAALIWVLLVSD